MSNRSKLTDALRQAAETQEKVREQFTGSEQIVAGAEGVSRVNQHPNPHPNPNPEANPDAENVFAHSDAQKVLDNSNPLQAPTSNVRAHIDAMAPEGSFGATNQGPPPIVPDSYEPNLDALESKNKLLDTMDRVVNETANAANMPATLVTPPPPGSYDPTPKDVADLPETPQHGAVASPLPGGDMIHGVYDEMAEQFRSMPTKPITKTEQARQSSGMTSDSFDRPDSFDRSGAFDGADSFDRSGAFDGPDSFDSFEQPSGHSTGPVLPEPQVPQVADDTDYRNQPAPALNVGSRQSTESTRRAPTDSPRVFLNDIKDLDGDTGRQSTGLSGGERPLPPPVISPAAPIAPRSNAEESPRLTSSLTTDSVYVEDPVAAANGITGWYEQPNEIPEDLPLYEIVPNANEDQAAAQMQSIAAAAAAAAAAPPSEDMHLASYPVSSEKLATAAAARNLSDQNTRPGQPEAIASPVNSAVIQSTQSAQATPARVPGGRRSSATSAASPSGFEIQVLGNLRDPKVRGQYEKMWQDIGKNKEADQIAPSLFAFVSCEPQSHVTDVTGHLAMFVANSTKEQILIVDGDQRGSRLSKKYGVSANLGLTNVLLQGEDWKSLVQTTANRNVVVLPAGTSAPPLGGFDQNVLEQLAQDWKSNFDYVFVDSGQAYSLSANSAYTVCDATYLVLRLGETNRNEADQVVQQLLEGQVPLNGCVVTNLP